jgi:transposase
MLTRDEFQALYDQGPDAVYALFQTLWATTTLQQERITALEEQNARLSARVHELEARLSKDSHNSSKPPSSDGLHKPTHKPCNLRKKTGKRTGGQPGHPGHTLELVDTPDHTVVHAPTTCTGCGGSLQDAPVLGKERRQVFELPPLQLEVTEHQVLSCVCPHCSTLNAGTFPETVTQPAQYGPNLLGLCVYLSQYQLLPLARTQELLVDLFGQSPSQGTLTAAIAACSRRLAPVETALKAALLRTPVLHSDETGVRVVKQLHWIHVACTSTLTCYAHHAKRGREAFMALGLLPHFEGTSVHDCLASYHDPSYACTHSLCNAHLLRELLGLFQTTQQTWSQRMSALLRSLKRAKEAALSAGKSALDPKLLVRYQALYRRIVERGLAQNPAPRRTGQRGRPINGVCRSLLLRLQEREDAVLRFALDFAVPFDNNQAERDLRMVKVQQKVSGCFRSTEGADHFCRIRGYISTLRKQGAGILSALRSVFMGNPVYPCFDPPV